MPGLPYGKNTSLNSDNNKYTSHVTKDENDECNSLL